MSQVLDIDLLQYQSSLKINKENNKRFIFDSLRKKFLVLTPEELVRQLLIQHFMQFCHYPKSKIALEKALKINTLTKRWDLLVYDKETKPWLLVECKAPHVKITQAVFEQISIYNQKLKVPYLMVSNGRENYCCKISYQEESFIFLNELPKYNVF